MSLTISSKLVRLEMRGCHLERSERSNVLISQALTPESQNVLDKQPDEERRIGDEKLARFSVFLRVFEGRP